MSFRKFICCVNTSSTQLDIHNHYNWIDSQIMVHYLNSKSLIKVPLNLYDKIIKTKIFINVDKSKLCIDQKKININLKYEYIGYNTINVSRHEVKLVLTNINRNTKINFNIDYKNMNVENIDLFVNNEDVYAYHHEYGKLNLNCFNFPFLNGKKGNKVTIILDDNMLNSQKLGNLNYWLVGWSKNKYFAAEYGLEINVAAKLKYRKWFGRKISTGDVNLHKVYNLTDLLKYCHNKKRIIKIIYILINNGFPYELLCIYLKYIVYNTFKLS